MNICKFIREWSNRRVIKRLARDLRSRGANVILIKDPVVYHPHIPGEVVQVHPHSAISLIDEARHSVTILLHRVSLINYDGVLRVRAAVLPRGHITDQ